MKIRRARADDLEVIAALYVQLKHHHGRLAPNTPRYEMPDEDWTAYARAALADPSYRIYVAERGPDVVAFLKLFFEQKSWGRSCEVETLVVDDSVRDRGIGSALMERAEEVAREEGARAMRVNVLHMNHEGRRFYEHRGYRTIAVRYGKPL